jgi:hypothetical protein
MIGQLTAAALLLLQIGPAGPRRCVAPRDMGDMAAVVAPHLIEALATRCAPFRGSTSFVGSDGGRALASRFRAEEATRSPGAVRALQALAGVDFPPNVPESVVLAFVGPSVGAQLTGLTAERCRAADRMIAALAPLPPGNIADMVETLVTLVPPEERSNIVICPTS